MLATTATTIGVELSSNTTTGAPTGVLGYRRAEFAFVPTNRSRQGEAAPDADQTPPDLSQVADVLMELSYGGTLSANGRIYQRLAVGRHAVTGSGAQLMFARDSDGLLPAAAAAAVGAGKATLGRVDRLVACTVKAGKLDATAMGRIVARAEQEPAGAAQVGPYKPLLVQGRPEAELRTLLANSDGLTQALARHLSEADCVAP